ncbi:nucleotidyltransferase domain-containing protein [Dactylosporangium sp. CA-152071]|uniref:nucleotidyltransferase domain-containing protein n=1 Tax=Dactylosporangium sp. CA-152071 TaxID=3239933 RepID=UPI003D918900
MDILEQVLARSTRDPAVRGVILMGSHARGLTTPRSDYDVTVAVADQAVAWRHSIRSAELDEVVCTVQALADTSVHWQRYAYRGAQVLLDRLDGGITELVHRQATPTEEEAVRLTRAALDAYTNQLYRAVKSHRDGFADAAHLDEIESVPWLLETVFALHGRLRPYNKYLHWELTNFPLPAFWNTALAPGRVATHALGLFPAVDTLARQHGHGDVLDAWGSDIELIRTFAEEAEPWAVRG